MALSRDEVLEFARNAARAVHAADAVAHYVVIATDEGSGLLVRRDLLREVLTRIVDSGGGIVSGSVDVLLEAVAEVARWKVPVILWYENTLEPCAWDPGNVQ